MHWLRKLGRTIRIFSQLGMARMFGRYEYSGFNGEIHYARYAWRGRSWIIPTSPAEGAPHHTICDCDDDCCMPQNCVFGEHAKSYR